MKTIKLNNTQATEKMALQIQMLCTLKIDGNPYCEGRHGYIFVQLSSVGHKDVRLFWDKKAQKWNLAHDFSKNKQEGLTFAEVISFIRNN